MHLLKEGENCHFLHKVKPILFLSGKKNNPATRVRSNYRYFMTKETLDKKAKIVENFNEKVKHFIFPSRESLNSDCSSQVF